MSTITEFLKGLFGSNSDIVGTELHKFCGFCGSAMKAVENKTIFGYSRIDGTPFFHVKTHRECSNRAAEGAHDIVL